MDPISLVVVILACVLSLGWRLLEQRRGGQQDDAGSYNSVCDRANPGATHRHAP